MSMSTSTTPSIPEELNAVSAITDDGLEYLAGSQPLSVAALAAAKFIFDHALKSEQLAAPHINQFITSISPSEAPQTRSQAKKRKRNEGPPKLCFTQTPLSGLIVNEMDDEQIWAQLELRTKLMCDIVDTIMDENVQEGDEETKDGINSAGISLDTDEDSGDEDSGDEDSEDEDIDFDDVESDENQDEDEENEEQDKEESEEELPGAETIAELQDSSEEDEDEFSISQSKAKSKAKPTPSAHGLDDGFFSLSAFNAEANAAESRRTSRGALGGSDDSDDDMSVDLFAPIEDDPQGMEEEDAGNGNDILYKDFFEVPRGKQHADSKKKTAVRFDEQVRVKKIKAKGKGLSLSAMYEDNDEEDIDEDGDIEMDGGEEEFEDQDESSSDNEDLEKDSESEGEAGRETINRLRDDLFAEEEEEDNEAEALTGYERRQAALKEQIETLETENVEKKDWVLMGEADSRSRPQNSLLEEDLEFERVAKAIPVTTTEAVQDLEDRIKARIIEGNFDDVVRLRAEQDKPFLPSRFFELQDTKSSQSLSQIYEDEYVATQTGGIAGEDRDGKLKKEHDEIEKLWDSISGKLDALCNAHFVPKQPKATISTVNNVSTTSLESALPTNNSVSTLLAPEEIFNPASSAPKTRSEMTPIEKRALRTKERKKKKKMRDSIDQNVDKYARMSKGGAKKQKEVALASVKSNKGVTIVGKPKKETKTKKHGK